MSEANLWYISTIDQSPKGAKRKLMPSTQTSIHFHLVFSTKNRLPLITDDWRDDLYGYLGGIIKNQKGTCPGGWWNRRSCPYAGGSNTITPTRLFIRELKTGSSGWARREKNPQFSWQKGYGGFTVSATNLEKVKNYIHNQEIHHKRMTFQEEYVELLKISGIEYDEEHLW